MLSKSFLQSTQLAEHRTKCSELQGAISDLERTTKEQLQGLVSQSELAIEAAHSKLVELQGRTQQYEQFVKVGRSNHCPSHSLGKVEFVKVRRSNHCPSHSLGRVEFVKVRWSKS